MNVRIETIRFHIILLAQSTVNSVLLFKMFINTLFLLYFTILLKGSFNVCVVLTENYCIYNGGPKIKELLGI